MSAYTDDIYYRAYFLARDVNVATQSTAAINAALLIATEYLDDTFEFAGYATVITQAQKWPRTGLYTQNGAVLDPDNVPAKVKDATCELAFIQQTQTGGLQPLFNGQVIKKTKDKLGDLEQEIEYDSAASATYERYYATAYKKISDYVISSGSNVVSIQRVI